MIDKSKIQKIVCIRNIYVSIISLIILIWAFYLNKFTIKLIITPFIVCSVAIFFENIFLLFNKEKISNIFKYIFRISLFTYIFGILIYIIYYSIIHKSYTLLVLVGIFLIFIIHFLKKAFIRGKNGYFRKK